MKKSKIIDLVILLVYPTIGALLCPLLKINAFGSVIIFFGLPSIYLTIRNIGYAKKSIIFSLMSSVPSIIIIDYISHLTGQWLIPNSILPYRLFTFVSIEVILWAILNVYFVVMFYEYFLNQHLIKKVWQPNMKYLTGIVSLLLVIFVAIYNFIPQYLNIPYFYLCFGLVLLLIPLSFHFFKHPKFILKFFKIAAYFFYLTLLYEITALQLGWWAFPGKQFLGWVYISNIRFPIEELVFWLSLFAMAILAYYEFFDDDEK